jgi:hypothetical protein
MIGPLLKREIESTFHVVASKCTAEELVFVCPECGDRTGNRSVNIKTSKTFCWRCNKGKNNKGHFLAWARALGYTFAVGDGGGSNIPVAELLNEPEPQGTVPVIQEVELPAGFTPIARTPASIYTKLIKKMALRKNLNLDDMTEAGVGYTMDDPRWESFAIFPVYEYDTCVYFQGRTYVDVPGETTKRFPSRGQIKWGATYWVYNIDTVRAVRPEVVVIVESILNVLSLRWKFRELGWDNVVPVCVFKHHLSQVQALKLLRCKGVKEFCMLFDHDAIEKTWQSVGYIGNKLKVTVAEMPFDKDNKKLDPNDDVEAAIRAIEKREVYTTATVGDRFLRSSTGFFDISGRSLKGSS